MKWEGKKFRLKFRSKGGGDKTKYNVLFVTLQVTSRRIVLREMAMKVVVHPSRLQVKRRVMRVLEQL